MFLANIHVRDALMPSLKTHTRMGKNTLHSGFSNSKHTHAPLHDHFGVQMGTQALEGRDGLPTGTYTVAPEVPLCTSLLFLRWLP